MKNKRLMLSVELSKDEYETMQTLKNKYSVNISQLVKNFFREYLKQVEKTNVNLNIQIATRK
jgi:hypothetical protein